MNNTNWLSNLSTQLIRAGQTVPCSMVPSNLLPEHDNLHGTVLMLLKRMCKLEQLHARTKWKLGRLMKKIRSKNRKIVILKVKLNQVKVAVSEFSESSTQYHNLNKKCKKLEKQLIDMKNFLKDYGLIWVGDEGNENSNIADNTLQRVAFPEKGVWRPDDSITGELVSFDLLLENIKYLNILANEGEAKITYTASGATFKDPISIPLTIYSNGIVLKSEPFRSYMEPSTQIFVADILDGFFPTELQAQYPEGVSFKVIDKRSVTYKGSENGWKVFNGVGYKLGDKLSEQNKEVSSSSLSNHYNTPKQPCKNNNSTYYANSAQTQEEERVISSFIYLKHSDKELNSNKSKSSVRKHIRKTAENIDRSTVLTLSKNKLIHKIAQHLSRLNCEPELKENDYSYRKKIFREKTKCTNIEFQRSEIQTNLHDGGTQLNNQKNDSVKITNSKAAINTHKILLYTIFDNSEKINYNKNVENPIKDAKQLESNSNYCELYGKNTYLPTSLAKFKETISNDADDILINKDSTLLEMNSKPTHISENSIKQYCYQLQTKKLPSILSKKKPLLENSPNEWTDNSAIQECLTNTFDDTSVHFDMNRNETSHNTIEESSEFVDLKSSNEIKNTLVKGSTKTVSKLCPLNHLSQNELFSQISLYRTLPSNLLQDVYLSHKSECKSKLPQLTNLKHFTKKENSNVPSTCAHENYKAYKNESCTNITDGMTESNKNHSIWIKSASETKLKDGSNTKQLVKFVSPIACNYEDDTSYLDMQTYTNIDRIPNIELSTQSSKTNLQFEQYGPEDKAEYDNGMDMLEHPVKDIKERIKTELRKISEIKPKNTIKREKPIRSKLNINISSGRLVKHKVNYSHPSNVVDRKISLGSAINKSTPNHCPKLRIMAGTSPKHVGQKNKGQNINSDLTSISSVPMSRARKVQTPLSQSRKHSPSREITLAGSLKSKQKDFIVSRQTLSEIEQLRRHTDDRVSTEHFLDKVSKIKAGDDRMLTYTREGVTHPPSVQQVIHNSISKYTISSDNIVLKVWSEDGSEVYMIHISADETVMSLEKLLDENRKILSNSELSARCGYRLYASNHLGRKTSLANTSLTLREYGITCNTVLYMQKTEPEQDHTGVVPFVNKFI